MSVQDTVGVSQKLVGKTRSYALNEDDTLTEDEAKNVSEKLEELSEIRKKRQPDRWHNNTEWADGDGVVRPPLWGTEPVIYLKDNNGNLGEYRLKK